MAKVLGFPDIDFEVLGLDEPDSPLLRIVQTCKRCGTVIVDRTMDVRTVAVAEGVEGFSEDDAEACLAHFDTCYA